MGTVVMITMEDVEPYKWLIAILGLLLMYVGIWISGHKWLSLIAALPMSLGVYWACCTKGSLWWMSGWMWYDREQEVIFILYGSVVALLCGVLVVLERIFCPEAKEEADTPESGEPKVNSESAATPE
ncbi:hypothetical protein [Pseudomonas sp. PLMAX]|uniref:hypothetical protein n=1 Tax=Pseudomonas sp. PLMAX TaxID=2201998 RepID=UPI0038B9B820